MFLLLKLFFLTIADGGRYNNNRGGRYNNQRGGRYNNRNDGRGYAGINPLSRLDQQDDDDDDSMGGRPQSNHR